MSLAVLQVAEFVKPLVDAISWAGILARSVFANCMADPFFGVRLSLPTCSTSPCLTYIVLLYRVASASGYSLRSLRQIYWEWASEARAAFVYRLAETHIAYVVTKPTARHSWAPDHRSPADGAIASHMCDSDEQRAAAPRCRVASFLSIHDTSAESALGRRPLACVLDGCFTMHNTHRQLHRALAYDALASALPACLPIRRP